MQRAINQFASLNTPRAVLHDEFRRIDAAEWQKRVWVQNSGNSPFIARISASEFMQWIEAEDWSRGRNIIEGIPFADPIPAAIETTLTPTLDADTWGVDGTLIDTQTAWFNVTADMWSIRGLTDPTSLAQAAPARGHAADGTPFSQYWEWDSDHLTYSEWTALPLSQRSNKWVLADDGFFYYTSVIRPETNTFPLMTGVSAASGFDPLKHAFYYAIDIQMEVVTQDDVSAMKDGLVPSSGTDGVPLRAASTQGKAILDAINWTAPIIAGLTINGIEDSSTTVWRGEEVTLEVDAGGDPDLTYLWQTTNSPWNDAPGTNDTDTYMVETTTPGTYEFRVLVSNSGNTPIENDGHTTVSDTITVIIKAGIGGDPIVIGSPRRVVIDGIPFWRIASNGYYDLIVTQYVYGTNPAVDFTGSGPGFNASGNGNYWLSNSASGSSPSNVSNLQTSMDTWWNALTPATHPNLNAWAVQADFGNGSGVITGAVDTRNFGVETGLTTSNAGSIANVNFTIFPQAQSRPSNPVRDAAATTTSTTAGQGIVTFALSGTEIVRYFPNTATGGSGAATTTTDSTLGRVGRGAGANHAGTTTARAWWTRSRGNNATTAGGVGTVGDVYGSWGSVGGDGTWDAPTGNSVTNTGLGLLLSLHIFTRLFLSSVRQLPMPLLCTNTTASCQLLTKMAKRLRITPASCTIEPPMFCVQRRRREAQMR
ncbi:MAG: immunoglobulin domain-containing protein [Coriobacteriia bacterium]|nr:immunoglobulin domain-containing protein [Coriobacteriia bacterium]